MLAQEVLISDIKAALTKLSLDLTCSLLVDEPLDFHLLLLTTQATQDARCLKLLRPALLVETKPLKAEACPGLLSGNVGLLGLHAELVLCLTGRVFLLLSGEAKACSFLPGLLSDLEGLLVEGFLLLARLLSGLERRLAELLRCLTSCLLLLLLTEVKLCSLLTSLLSELECSLLKLLLLNPTLDVLRFGRLTELLLRLKGSIVLLGGRQAKLCGSLPGLLSGLECLGIKLLGSTAIRLIDFKGALLELLLGLPGLLFLLLSIQAKLCCTLTGLLAKLERTLSKLLLQGLPFQIGLECLLAELFLRLPSGILLLLRAETQICCALTRLLTSFKGLDRHLLLGLAGLFGRLKCRLAKTLCFLPGLILSLTCGEAELSLLKPSSTICLKGLQRLLVGCLTATGLNILKLLAEVALTLRLHNRFPVAA